MATDHVLKLYAETLKSPYLHYGFWDNPNSVTLDTFQLKDIVAAQQRYIEHLCSFIPKGIHSVLDVGCGLGGNAAFLRGRGYDVDVLTPDPYQAQSIRERFQGELTCHQSRFEDFKSTKTYDLILESESACYIDMQQGFEVARHTLRDGGYLLVSDYFVHFQDGSGSPHLRSSHPEQAYLQYAQDGGFKLIREYDQTENTLPTLKLASELTQRFFKPIGGYVLSSFERKHPVLFSVSRKLFGKKLAKKQRELQLIDGDQFRKYRKYMIFLFQKSYFCLCKKGMSSTMS